MKHFKKLVSKNYYYMIIYMGAVILTCNISNQPLLKNDFDIKNKI